MDVRFYPSAGGNSIPGDPPNLDFAHCLGYYNFNKVKKKKKRNKKSKPSVLCSNLVLCCVATLVRSNSGADPSINDWQSALK